MAIAGGIFRRELDGGYFRCLRRRLREGEWPNRILLFKWCLAEAILDMVINGEYMLSPTVYDSHTTNSKQQGAAV